jgi:hypothetical protein
VPGRGLAIAAGVVCLLVAGLGLLVNAGLWATANLIESLTRTPPAYAPPAPVAQSVARSLPGLAPYKLDDPPPTGMSYAERCAVVDAVARQQPLAPDHIELFHQILSSSGRMLTGLPPGPLDRESLAGSVREVKASRSERQYTLDGRMITVAFARGDVNLRRKYADIRWPPDATPRLPDGRPVNRDDWNPLARDRWVQRNQGLFVNATQAAAVVRLLAERGAMPLDTPPYLDRFQLQVHPAGRGSVEVRERYGGSWLIVLPDGRYIDSENTASAALADPATGLLPPLPAPPAPPHLGVAPEALAAIRVTVLVQALLALGLAVVAVLIITAARAAVPAMAAWCVLKLLSVGASLGVEGFVAVTLDVPASTPSAPLNLMTSADYVVRSNLLAAALSAALPVTLLILWRRTTLGEWLRPRRVTHRSASDAGEAASARGEGWAGAAAWVTILIGCVAAAYHLALASFAVPKGEGGVAGGHLCAVALSAGAAAVAAIAWWSPLLRPRSAAALVAAAVATASLFAPAPAWAQPDRRQAVERVPDERTARAVIERLRSAKTPEAQAALFHRLNPPGDVLRRTIRKAYLECPDRDARMTFLNEVGWFTDGLHSVLEDPAPTDAFRRCVLADMLDPQTTPEQFWRVSSLYSSGPRPEDWNADLALLLRSGRDNVVSWAAARLGGPPGTRLAPEVAAAVEEAAARATNPDLKLGLRDRVIRDRNRTADDWLAAIDSDDERARLLARNFFMQVREVDPNLAARAVRLLGSDPAKHSWVLTLPLKPDQLVTVVSTLLNLDRPAEVRYRAMEQLAVAQRDERVVQAVKQLTRSNQLRLLREAAESPGSRFESWWMTLMVDVLDTSDDPELLSAAAALLPPVERGGAPVLHRIKALLKQASAADLPAALREARTRVGVSPSSLDFGAANTWPPAPPPPPAPAAPPPPTTPATPWLLASLATLGAAGVLAAALRRGGSSV